MITDVMVQMTVEMTVMSVDAVSVFHGIGAYAWNEVGPKSSMI